MAHRLVDLKHVGFSWTRDSTRVPCIGRRILNHELSEKPAHTFLLLLLDCFSVPVLYKNACRCTFSYSAILIE